MKLTTRLLALLLVIILSLSLLISCDFSLDSLFGGSSVHNGITYTPGGSTADNPTQTPSTTPSETPGETPTPDNTPITPDNTDDPTIPDDTPPVTPDDDTPVAPGDTPVTPDDGTTTPDFTTDPYIGVDKTLFYQNYTPAVCYQDAVWRTEHYLMSGSIASQDQAPTTAANQPKQNGLYVRNTSALYADNGNTYIVLDVNGNEAFRVYRGGGYVTLEEVAAYVYAFGDIPANHISKKSGSPSSNPWGIYLRLNHSSFSGNTDKYPYEPVLPDISGCGGDLQYYELDIGTTGTDCDPDYTAKLYNNGSTITRGAARIVYARYDANGDNIIDPNERYLFYTYNHYNDFQEYLNYEGGWGQIFGNITGGGAISDKYNCNPTPYVLTARRDFSVSSAGYTIVEMVAILPDTVNTILNNRRAFV